MSLSKTLRRALGALAAVTVVVAAGATPGPISGDGSASRAGSSPEIEVAPATFRVSDPAPGDPTKTVHYRGVEVDVPAAMPVVDLGAHPDTCVRTDRDVVYVGTPGANQNCPARAVGRSDSVWIGPRTPTTDAEVAAGENTEHEGLIRREKTSEASQQTTVVVPDSNVAVQTTWGQTPAAMEQVVASVAVDPAASGTASAGPPAPPATSMGAPTPTGASTSAAAAAHSPAPSTISVETVAYSTAVVPDAMSTATAASTVLTGMAFDTCAAPSVATMQKWRSSPYSAVGIYIGGAMRACGDGNLSADWVSQVAAQGWGFIPIYVGLQAPCVTQPGLARISLDLATARNQGSAAAQDAVAAATRFGLGRGSTLYFDMESYSMSDTGCSAATVAFIQSWTTGLGSAGYRSGVYGGVGSMMRDLARAAQQGAGGIPDAIWLAHWNDVQTTRDTYSPQYVPDSLWTGSNRIRQYGGDRSESWGGATINIDPNWVDTPLPGNPVQTDYGTAATGPGGRGFVFTGPMSYWRASPGTGIAKKGFWTRPSGSSVEGNGATWTAALSPGRYAVEAYVPSSSGGAVGRYTLTAGGQDTNVQLDQSSASGWRRLGEVTAGSDGKVRVHLGDNGSTDTTQTLWADAVRWTPVASGQAGQPGTPRATAADHAASVTWGAPATGGPVASYTVTATPGGANVTVPGGTLTATVTGLANGTAYTFTVRANGSAGAGPVSVASNQVIPGAPWTRLAGPDQYDTSAAITAAGFPSAQEVFIASGENFPDALAGGVIAGQRRAPLLLTAASTLPAVIADQLRRLHPSTTYLLGGPLAVSESVVGQIATATGGQVVRLAGDVQYDTAGVIATRFKPTAGTVYLTSGLNFRDAASGGAAAARQGAALVLTGTGALPPATRSYLSAARPTKVVILGGPLAVPTSAESEVAAILPGVTVLRYGGVDAYETAAIVNTNVFGSLTRPVMAYAPGEDFPDALSGTPLATILGGGMLLTTSTCHPRSIADATVRLDPAKRYALGGSDVTWAGETGC